APRAAAGGAREPDPAPAPAEPAVGAEAATPPAPAPTGSPILRAAVLAGGFLAAAAGVALAAVRRRRPAPPALAPTVILPAEAAPASSPATVPAVAAPAPSAATVPALARTVPLLDPDTEAAPPPPAVFARDTVRVPPPGRPTVAYARTATGFDPAALDARTEAAVAEALSAPDGPASFPGGGRYELLGEIGRGGMGIVYRARDKRLDRIVALKRLSEHLQTDSRAIELLLREARSAAQLNHPHIVTVY